MTIFALIKDRSALLKSFSTHIIGFLVIALLGSTIFLNVAAAYAQSFTGVQSPKTQPSLHLVKIISPAKGQQVSVGRDLPISGTSRDNTTTPNCKVSIKVNFVSPYHDALPIGVGAHNYSK